MPDGWSSRHVWGWPMPNPIRSTHRYRTARALWLAGFKGQPHPCCMCGIPVDTSLPGTHPHGPTVEHQLPIRHIEAMARDFTQAVALACDTSMWGLAHKVCQDRQGAGVVNAARGARRAMIGASREW